MFLIFYIHFEVANDHWKGNVWKLHVGGSAVLNCNGTC
jgi:hypothetical protein